MKDLREDLKRAKDLEAREAKFIPADRVYTSRSQQQDMPTRSRAVGISRKILTTNCTDYTKTISCDPWFQLTNDLIVNSDMLGIPVG